MCVFFCTRLFFVLYLYYQIKTIVIMNSAVNKKLAFGSKKMTIISELLRNEKCHANHYSLCRAKGVRGAIYMVERTQEDKFIFIGKGF